jgi:CMP-N-acetylneuraminic acid synthetase
VYAGQRILAVVPARGGSRGVQLKNLHELAGVPLIVHTARVIQETGVVDRAVVSTDHAGTKAVAEGCGLSAPFVRPAALSGDLVGDLEVLQHAVHAIEALDGLRYDIVLMLQPTSPLRRAEHLRAAVQTLVDGSWDSVWSVSPTDLKYHPLKQLTLAPDQTLAYFDERGRAIIARQQLLPVYHRNGAVYAFTRRCLIEQGTIMGWRSTAIVIDEPMISIDTLADFASVEALLAQRKLAEA